MKAICSRAPVGVTRSPTRTSLIVGSLTHGSEEKLTHAQQCLQTRFCLGGAEVIPPRFGIRAVVVGKNRELPVLEECPRARRRERLRMPGVETKTGQHALNHKAPR